MIKSITAALLMFGTIITPAYADHEYSRYGDEDREQSERERYDDRDDNREEYVDRNRGGSRYGESYTRRRGNIVERYEYRSYERSRPSTTRRGNIDRRRTGTCCSNGR